MVGDVIKLNEHTKVPADVIILATSEKNGSGYCSTATLDGEATLKPKQAVMQTQKLYDNAPDSETSFLLNLCLEVSCQQPSKNMHNFKAMVKLEKPEDGSCDSPSRSPSRSSSISNKIYVGTN
jgi:phospholipid-translocating ATPase